MKTRRLLMALIAIVFTASTVLAEILTGSCGDNATYTLDTWTGLLKIEGTGTMSFYDTAAWRSSRGSITKAEIADGITSFGNNAFYGCSDLTSITIPNSVTSIGEHAFWYCSSLTSITIPNSVTSIGNWAFDNCTSLPIIDNIRYADTYLIEATDRTLPTYNIKEGTKFIGSSAFQRCSDLTSITIPNSVTSIGYNAFEGCSGLTSITIPNSVTSIGSSAFAGCSGLTSITIPNSVTSIEYNSFSGCSNVESLTWGSDVSPNAVIGYCKNNLKNVTLLDGITSIEEGAFKECSGLTFITIPESVTSIGSYAFQNCTSLTSVTIPNSVTSIEYRTFHNCTSLTSVVIPNSVTSIGGYAFYNCTSLTSVKIPNSVTSLGEDAFVGCSALTSAVIGNSVTKIEDSTFYLCYNLASVSIGSSVTSIGYEAFGSCRSLSSIVSHAMEPPYCSNLAFRAIPSDAVLTVYISAADAYRKADYWKNFIINTMHDPQPIYVASNKWTGENYSVDAIYYDSGVAYDGSKHNNVVGVPAKDKSGRNWYDTDYTLTNNKSSWQTRTAPLNNWCSSNNFGDIYARREFTFTGDLPSDLYLACGHDDGPAEYYINGVQVWAAGDYWKEEEVIKLTKAQIALLKPDEKNVIAFHVHQNFGGMYADCGLFSYLSDLGFTNNRCGENLVWDFDVETSTLTISGTGSMDYYNVGGGQKIYAPWYGFIAQIKHLVVEEGVTNISHDAFAHQDDHNASSIETVSLPESLISIDEAAFRCSSHLTSINLPSGLKIVGNYAFDRCDNLREVTCGAATPPAVYWISFSKYGVLHVLPGCKAVYENAGYWNNFTIVDDAILDGTPIYFDTIHSYDVLNYTRTFSSTDWEALYVPFAMSYEDWAENFEIAEINNLHQYDTNDDGKPDLTELEVFVLHEGKLQPNTPYLIRAKTTGVQTITVPNVTIYRTESSSFFCYSMKYRYTFDGTYSRNPLLNVYGVQNGELVLQDNNTTSKPQRWYMTLTPRGTAKADAPARIRIRTTEDYVDGTALTPAPSPDDNAIYDLQGRKVKNARNGLFIQNGRVVLMK